MTVSGSRPNSVTGPAVLATVEFRGDLADLTDDLALDGARSTAYDEAGDELSGTAFLTAALALDGDLDAIEEPDSDAGGVTTPDVGSETPVPTPANELRGGKWTERTEGPGKGGPVTTDEATIPDSPQVEGDEGRDEEGDAPASDRPAQTPTGPYGSAVDATGSDSGGSFDLGPLPDGLADGGRSAVSGFVSFLRSLL